MLSEPVPAEAYWGGIYIVYGPYEALGTIETVGEGKTGTDWEHLYANCLKSHVVVLGFEP